ncbi:MAG: hypothetical protein WCK09_20410 [Bacteroidota bacterium]
MKKQQFLFVLLLAIFAGISSANAQCVGSWGTPAAGVPYTYDVTVSGTGYTGVGTYDWYVTQNVNIIDAASIIPKVNTFFTVDEATVGYSDYHNILGFTSNQLNLTWTPLSISSGTFYLVLRYTEANSTASPACSAENIRVWQITPINTFMLAIEGATSGGASFAPAEQCAAPLLSAVVTPGASPTVNYTYDMSTIFYRVTGSGILGDWRPSIRIPALAGLGQNYVAVEWNQDITGAGGTWQTFNVPAGNTAGGDFVSTANATITDAVVGTPILIRVKIANVNYETLADQAILVGVDGYLPTAYTASDINGGAGPVPDPCAQAAPFAKEATYTILARPTITKGAAMPAFIVKLP